MKNVKEVGDVIDEIVDIGVIRAENIFTHASTRVTRGTVTNFANVCNLSAIAWQRYTILLPPQRMAELAIRLMLDTNVSGIYGTRGIFRHYTYFNLTTGASCCCQPN